VLVFKEEDRAKSWSLPYCLEHTHLLFLRNTQHPDASRASTRFLAFLRSQISGVRFFLLGKALFVLLLACIADDTPRTYYGLEMVFWIL